MQALMELEKLQLFFRLRRFFLCGIWGCVRIGLCRGGSRGFFGNREVTLRHFSRGDSLPGARGFRVFLRMPMMHDIRYGTRMSLPTEELCQ